MTTEKKVFIVQVIVFSVVFVLPASLALAAVDTDNGLQRGGNRMTPPTVDICVQRSGKTVAECELMMSQFAERKSFGQGNVGQGTDRSNYGARGETRDDNRPGRFGLESTDRFESMKNRLIRVVEFLKTKGVDTGELEDDFSILKDKMAVAQSDFVTFQNARTVWRADQSATNKVALDAARVTTKESVMAVKTYYHNTLLPLLKALLQSVA